jgi:hypothetical protein
MDEKSTNRTGAPSKPAFGLSGAFLSLSGPQSERNLLTHTIQREKPCTNFADYFPRNC